MRASLRALVLASAVLAASLSMSTTAGADEVGIQANGPSGCNNNVCVYTAYTGFGYQVWAEFRHTNVQDGHLDVWGPGLSRRSSANGFWPAGHDTPRWSAQGNGWVCAEGWSRIGGVWSSVGLPCVLIG